MNNNQYWKEVQDLGLSAEEMLGHFPSFIRHYEMTKFLAHYELFKQIVDLPGCVVELGIFCGASFFTWTKLMDIFCPGDRTRKVYGFDWFQGLDNFSEKDGKPDSTIDKKIVGAYKADIYLVRKLVELNTQDGLLPGVQRGFLVEGDVCQTLGNFLENNPGLRISLLYLDMDLYEPTKVALEMLYPRVVSGGVVAFDEYGLAPWEGETIAVEEYFHDNFGGMPRLKKFPFSVAPHGYFIKS